LAARAGKAHSGPAGTEEARQQEVSMIDQDTARLWADHHEAFGRWVDDAAKGIGKAFRTLHRIQYEAPWHTTARTRARH
jgi:hypothetical protein